jgi:hypothetical protein
MLNSSLVGRDNRHRKSEKEEDEELLQEGEEEDEALVFEESPPCEPEEYFYQADTNVRYSCKGRTNERLSSTGFKLDGLTTSKWDQRYSCRRDGKSHIASLRLKLTTTYRVSAKHYRPSRS